jgi:hypothetical protein
MADSGGVTPARVVTLGSFKVLCDAAHVAVAREWLLVLRPDIEHHNFSSSSPTWDVGFTDPLQTVTVLDDGGLRHLQLDHALFGFRAQDVCTLTGASGPVLSAAQASAIVSEGAKPLSGKRRELCEFIFIKGSYGM